MKLLSILPILAIVAVAGCVGQAPGEQPPGEETEAVMEAAVAITSSGYGPSVVRLKLGGTVTWTNENSAPHWVASSVHPTHTVYPGSSIGKCGTAEAADIFDACSALGPGESYSFTFNEAGTWGYHDHLNPGRRAQVIVEG